MLYQFYYCLSPRQSQQLIWDRFINTQGIRGRNISCDLYMEHLNRVVKEAVKSKGSNKTAAVFKRVVQAIGTIEPVISNFDSDNSVSAPVGSHTCASSEMDRDMILKKLNGGFVFRVDNKRRFQFYVVKGSLLHKITVDELQQWICKHIK